MPPWWPGRLLLALYLLFLVYGSLFPFHVLTDRAAIEESLRAAVLWPYDAAGDRRFSLPDVVSNLLLGVPFGLLLVFAGLVGVSARRRVLTATAIAFVVAVAIEAGQVLTPDRVPSLIDAAAQAAGSMVGALAAHAGLRAGRGALAELLFALFRRRPALGPLAVVTAALLADALYPFAPTLDVSTVWASFKRARWSLVPDLAWHAILVQEVLPYVLLGALAAMALSPRSPRTVRGPAWAGCLVLAVSLEVAKLFIEGRAPDLGHVSAAAVGAGVGVLAARARPPGGPVLVAGAVGLVAYAELAPFDFASWTPMMEALEWPPFVSYYYAEPAGVLVEVGRKLLLGGLLGAALRRAAAPSPSLWALGLFLGLEAGQLFERSHYASLADVVVLTLGSAAGSALLARYRAVLDSA